jgi:hypothetical protein
MSIPLLIALLVLILLYGLAWNNKRARQPGRDRRDKRKQPPHGD